MFDIEVTRTSKNIGYCPECGNEIRFKKRPYSGQTLFCHECEAELEVTSPSPIELEVVVDDYDEDEDFEDFEDGVYQAGYSKKKR